METRIAELIAELPEEVRGPVAREQELRELLLELAHKPVPASRVFRVWSLGTLQAKIAAAYLASWLRGSFKDREEKERLRNEAHLKAALQLLGSMGYLRGAIMKVGQTLASYPQIVPREYCDTLEALHFQAPPMHYSLLREHVRNELGADPEDLFAEFDPQAFAAASLGQVHRARLKSGEEVAVKIQYPNIARTIRGDFANGRALFQPMRLTKDWNNLMDSWAEIERMLLLEADYRNELANAEKVRAALAELDDVVVPRMVPEYSSERVLTMEWLDGKHPGPFMASGPDQELCNRHGEQLLRVYVRLLFEGRMFHADPNPGNYLMLKDGRLGLLDFGWVRACDDEEWALMKLGVEAFEQGGETLRESIRQSALLTDEELDDGERLGLLTDACQWQWEPLRQDGAFDFGDEENLERGLRLISQLIAKRYTKTRSIFLSMNRTTYGMRAVLFTLKSRVNVRALNHDELVRAGLT